MLRNKRYICLLATMLVLGCGPEVTIEPTGSGSGSGGRGGSAGQGGAGGAGGAGGTGGSSGEGGGGGEGGGPVGNHGPASDMVSSGKVTKSTNYKLVWTMGQSTQNQSKMSTPKYRLQGGLVGANGSVP